MSNEDYVTLFAAFTIALCIVSRIEGASAGAAQMPLANWQHFEAKVSQALADQQMQTDWANSPLW
ncbi:MAG TPA: hypothetical protein VMU87_01505 [Stellaceae bacterium]|nr:hypothetical protein [Stellaceae bacterium]